MVGFRGAKDPLSLDFGTGFTIITGRNGSGKSTVADAIEFALTGSVSKYASSSERSEDVNDYLWWRGAGSSTERSVRVTFTEGDAAAAEIVRTPDALHVKGSPNIEGILCQQDISPQDGVQVWCRTSIIRDEQITSFSVDIRETDRYAFVREAVGSLRDFPILEQRLKEISRDLTERRGRADKEIVGLRGKLEMAGASLARAEAEQKPGSEISHAEASLRSALGFTGDRIALGAESEKLSRDLRSRFERLSALVPRLNAAFSERERLQSPAVVEARTVANNRVSALQSQREELQRMIERLDRAWNESRTREEFAASLAVLHEHGKRLGLQSGRCPLCNSAIDQDQYEVALANILEAVGRTSQELARLASERRKVADDLRSTERELDSARRAEADFSLQAESNAQLLASLREEAGSLGIGPDVFESSGVSGVLARVDSLKKELSFVDQNRAILAASLAYSRLAEEEITTRTLRETEGNLSSALARIEVAENTIKAAQHELKTFVAGAIDDYLAAIEPLLRELYQRLRPHSDWTNVKYLIRGEVRKYLSLVVGDSLNLRFMFSSGQRRAVGLAFLLAVTLARPWCRLQTVILDDPVQHVDDFRALHLVETLAAVRQTGRQIICTVEDPELAKLLARRLRASRLGEGRLIQLQYSPGGGVSVMREESLFPFARTLLRSA